VELEYSKMTVILKKTEGVKKVQKLLHTWKSGTRTKVRPGA
jgi:hypothetical protein